MSEEEGIIELDTEFAKLIGFTSDKFDDISYLYQEGNYIFISMIKSIDKHKGNLTKLFDAIQREGYEIKVPRPFPLMELILIRKGFRKTIEHSEQMGAVEVWVKGINEQKKRSVE
ncbi:hypothetical protein KAW18_18695 [candidate division WOR-3 bacterium]|nr:hypothetical protein [candidate division WOR-3 bacterium]